MHKLNFSIDIKAPLAKVCQLMLDDAGYRQWTTPFHPGSFFIGDWQTGSTMWFVAEENGQQQGMAARANRLNCEKRIGGPQLIIVQNSGRPSDQPTDIIAQQEAPHAVLLNHRIDSFGVRDPFLLVQTDIEGRAKVRCPPLYNGAVDPACWRREAGKIKGLSGGSVAEDDDGM